MLNDTKPYGNILDFREQRQAVDDAITLFSGEDKENAKEIWLADPAPVVIENLGIAVNKLDMFMQSQGLTLAPEEVNNLRGDAARINFVNLFKEVQRLETQLGQYTDLTPENKTTITQILPEDQLQAFRGMYLETAQRLKEKQEKQKEKAEAEVQQLEFEFVLFASAVIDYDYIMNLLARYSQARPGKETMTRDELIGLIASDAKFMDEREDITAYISTLEPGKGLSEREIREGYEAFKAQKSAQELTQIAQAHGLDSAALKAFVDTIMQRMIFDGESLSDLLAPLGLGWRARTRTELALMDDLVPLLHKLSQGREISGLEAYE